MPVIQSFKRTRKTASDPGLCVVFGVIIQQFSSLSKRARASMETADGDTT